MVQRLGVHLPEALGHGLDRLAPPVQHQPAQIALAAGALILARQRLQDVIGERLQALPDGGQLGRCDTSHSALLTDRRTHPPTHHRSGANLTESY
jgi:hypothetical protein